MAGNTRAQIIFSGRSKNGFVYFLRKSTNSYSHRIYSKNDTQNKLKFGDALFEECKQGIVEMKLQHIKEKLALINLHEHKSSII